MTHGGDVYTVSKLLGKNFKHIVDLSSSVNPLPLPAEIKEKLIESLDFIDRYPDTETRLFRETFSQVYSIPVENIICGNGSTELIYLVVQALSPKKALILEPTFTEYERACRLHKVHVEKVFSLDKDELIVLVEKALSKNSYDMIFICNPNNPTGWLFEKDKILSLIKRAKDTVFIIDEAFIDFAEEETLIYHAKDLENVIVLRSLTKFYGLAGLRFGYGVSQKKLIEKLKNFSQPWNVNTLAQVAGTEIIKHKEFKRKSLEFFKKEKEFLEKSFYRKGIDYFPSVANFYLLKLPDGGFAKYILEKGILVRDCSNFCGLDDRFIRISVKTRLENERILRELENWLDIKKQEVKIEENNNSSSWKSQKICQ